MTNNDNKMTDDQLADRLRLANLLISAYEQQDIDIEKAYDDHSSHDDGLVSRCPVCAIRQYL